MKKIHVNASKEYDVLIQKGLLKDASGYISGINGIKTAVIISDDNVFAIYGDALKSSIEAGGVDVEEFVFEHGEQNKNLSTYEQIMEFMCASRVTRTDVVIALGGGVVGDVSGFVAATYQRGVKYIQIPTTLLAAVDSSVGGKTAVDLKGGKNQAGCFYQPYMVLCDPDTFETLPKEEFRCGMAEVIKYAVYGNRKFFDELKNIDIKEQIEHVIATCVEMKKEIVEADELDTGQRMLLNFGHTFGHAAEACSEFSLLHGEAVAMGMAAMTRSAHKQGVCDEATVLEMEAILKQYGLPVKLPYSSKEMMNAIYTDKKLAGDIIRIVIPEYIGKCRIEAVPVESLEQMLKDAGNE